MKKYRNILNFVVLVVFGLLGWVLFGNSSEYMESSPLVMIVLIVFKIAFAWLLWHYGRKMYFYFLPPIDWNKKIHKDSEVRLYEVFSIIAFVCIFMAFNSYS